VGVLNSFLKGRDWLVGDKCTYADLSFVMWNVSIDLSLTGGPVAWDIEEFPEFKRWMDAMKSRPAVGKVLMNMQASEMSSEGTR
jgi:glutathione S-transferase